MVMVFKANFQIDWTIRQGKNTVRGTCFSLLLPYYKNPFLDLGQNIVKRLGQCFLPELAN